MLYRERKKQLAESQEAGKEKAPASTEVKTQVIAPGAESESGKEKEISPAASSEPAPTSKKKKVPEGEVHTGFTVDKELLKDFSKLANLKGRKNKYLFECFMQAFVFSPRETIEFIENKAEEGLKK